MKLNYLAALILLVAAAGWRPAPAWAWTPAMEERIAAEATRLMPPSLRSILELHVQEVRSGLRNAASDEGSPVHSMNESRAKGGGTAARAEALVSGIVAMIDGHRPFAQVARQMGELAHVICDLENPLHTSDQDPLESHYALDYEQYVESNLDRYPLVFYGWGSEALDAAGSSSGRGDVGLFAEETAARARRYYAAIRRAYAPDNPEPPARRFDVRSLPFGIGSLSYSRSVTDTARLWRHIWHRAHGDMSGTPYLASETRPADEKQGGSSRRGSQ
jgi:hypothetical protein